MAKNIPQSAAKKKEKIKQIPEQARRGENFENSFPSWRWSKFDLEHEDWGVKKCDILYRFIIDDDILDSISLLRDLSEDDVNNILKLIENIENKKYNNLSDISADLNHKNPNYNFTRNLLKSINVKNLFKDLILSRLRHFEMKTWGEITREIYGKDGKSKHHFVKTNELTRKAQSRLRQLKRDDIDQVFSLRLDGTFRVIGIVNSSVFEVLWIDLEHEAVPTNLKHT